MSCAIVIHGPIGSGKTCTCLKLAEMARAGGIAVSGILSVRVHQDGALVGYDGRDLACGQVFPLVRLRSRVEGSDWFSFDRLKYAFSVPGFERANRILASSADGLGRSSIVFVDEFGRLERAGQGIYTGAERVAEALRGGGVAVFACRGDLVEVVEELLRGGTEAVFRHEPGDAEELWRRVQEFLGRACER